ncbi:hypothetical protein UYSO10_3412 [Kosakonia radicincitans]|nr:hypothetical protein UYSO10_3412 [Kosakonia radicincitans]
MEHLLFIDINSRNLKKVDDLSEAKTKLRRKYAVRLTE